VREWLYRRARRRYRRHINRIWDVRQDAIGLTMHLHDGVPWLFDDTPLNASGWYPVQTVVDVANKDTPMFELSETQQLYDAAAKLGGCYFWVTDTERGEKYSVFVVKEPDPREDAT